MGESGPSNKPPPPKVATRLPYQSPPYARDEVLVSFSAQTTPTTAKIPVDRHPSKEKEEIPAALPVSSETSVETSTLAHTKTDTLSKRSTLDTPILISHHHHHFYSALRCCLFYVISHF